MTCIGASCYKLLSRIISSTIKRYDSCDELLSRRVSTNIFLLALIPLFIRNITLIQLKGNIMRYIFCFSNKLFNDKLQIILMSAFSPLLAFSPFLD